jgi:hypothetical protein
MNGYVSPVYLEGWTSSTPMGSLWHYGRSCSCSTAASWASAIGNGGLADVGHPIVDGDVLADKRMERDSLLRRVMEPYPLRINRNRLDTLYSLTQPDTTAELTYFFHPDHLGSASWYQEAAGYHVSNSIKNNNHIFEVNYGAEVEMSAKSIVLSNGFHAHNGATFRAMINPCTPVELRSGALDSSIIDSFDIFYNKELDNNIVSNGIILYPNPSSGELNLFLESNLGEISSVTIINAIGMVVLQKNEIGNKSINVSCLPNGIYFVKVLTSKGECLFSKFIKQ